MCPGDVILIQYASKTVPGTYRLGRVHSVEIDADTEADPEYILSDFS